MTSISRATATLAERSRFDDDDRYRRKRRNDLLQGRPTLEGELIIAGPWPFNR